MAPSWLFCVCAPLQLVKGAKRLDTVGACEVSHVASCYLAPAMPRNTNPNKATPFFQGNRKRFVPSCRLDELDTLLTGQRHERSHYGGTLNADL